MTHEDLRKALLEESGGPKETRTNDGRIFVLEAVERWALGGGRLVVMEGAEGRMNILSIRNIASVGIPPAMLRNPEALESVGGRRGSCGPDSQGAAAKIRTTLPPVQPRRTSAGASLTATSVQPDP